MPDELHPVVPIKLGGKMRRLKCTIGAVYQLKELTGIDVYRDGIKVIDMEADDFRALVWSCLIPEDKKTLTLKDINRMVNKKNILYILVPVKQALALAWPKSPKEEGKENGKKESPGWLEIWAIGRQTLGLGEDEFWRLTLAQFMALLERYKAEQERLDYRTGVVASSILNTIPRTEETKNKIFTPADIFPHYGWGEDAGETDEDDIRAHYKQFALMNDAEFSEN